MSTILSLFCQIPDSPGIVVTGRRCPTMTVESWRGKPVPDAKTVMSIGMDIHKRHVLEFAPE